MPVGCALTGWAVAPAPIGVTGPRVGAEKALSVSPSTWASVASPLAVAAAVRVAAVAVTSDATTAPAAGATVRRPSWAAPCSLNHSAPSAPLVMPSGDEPAPGAVVAIVIVPSLATRPTPWAPESVKYSAPSAPATRSCGALLSGSPSWKRGGVASTPAAEMRPIAGLVPRTVNQRLPSGPAAMSPSVPLPSVTGNSLTWPWTVIRPMRPLAASVNHSASSGPATMSWGSAFVVRPAVNSVVAPDGLIRTMVPFLPCAVYQSDPSAPAAMPTGLSCEAPENSVTVPLAVTRPILFLLVSVNHMPPGPAVIAPNTTSRLSPVV